MSAGTLLAAIAALAFPLGAPVQAGAHGWLVLDARPGIAVFVSDPASGPQNARAVDTMIVLATPEAGMDIEVTHWLVDCGAMSILGKGGTGHLGADKVRDIPSRTGGHIEPAGRGTGKGMIAAYACTGKRISSDATRLATDADAIAHGRKIAAK